jgi:hypothetical protein
MVRRKGVILGGSILEWCHRKEAERWKVKGERRKVKGKSKGG